MMPDLLLEHPRVNVEALSNRTPLFRERVSSLPCRRLTFHPSIVPKSTRRFERSLGVMNTR